jgi:hypothetical protein
VKQYDAEWGNELQINSTLTSSLKEFFQRKCKEVKINKAFKKKFLVYRSFTGIGG